MNALVLNRQSGLIEEKTFIHELKEVTATARGEGEGEIAGAIKLRCMEAAKNGCSSATLYTESEEELAALEAMATSMGLRLTDSISHGPERALQFPPVYCVTLSW